MRKLFTIATALAVALTATEAVLAGNGTPINTGSANVLTLAVYGDSPYGSVEPPDTQQLQDTPALINSINGDPKVDLVLHVGDIHSGSDHCSVNYNQKVLWLWQGFKDPLVYTPGDNEWTDCNKAKEGGFDYPKTPWASPSCTVFSPQTKCDGYFNTGNTYGDPLDNLALVRSLFFPKPGTTLGGRKKQVLSQAVVDPNYPDYVENVMWEESKVVFATVNMPGSNNDLRPWYKQSITSRQTGEVMNRNQANMAWLKRVFKQANDDGVAGIVIGLQADMWDPEAIASGGDGLDGYKEFVQLLASEAKNFGKPVLLINGDSHLYGVDQPFTKDFYDGTWDYGSPATTGSSKSHTTIKDFYSIGHEVPNVQRITVEGSTNAKAKWWLRLTVDPNKKAAELFSWQPVDLRP